VTVIGIRQFNGRDQMLEARDEAVPHVGIHQRAGALQVFRFQIRALCQDVPNPLFVKSATSSAVP